MFIRPFQHHDQCAVGQLSFDYRRRLDINLRFIPSIKGMKLRPVVFATNVYVDEYPKKLAYGRHDLNPGYSNRR